MLWMRLQAFFRDHATSIIGGKGLGDGDISKCQRAFQSRERYALTDPG